MEAIATLAEAISQGFRVYSYTDEGIVVRKEVSHGVFIKAFVKYKPA